MIKPTPLAIVIGTLLSASAVAEETSYSLDEVVVSATRLNTQTIDTAASVTVIDEEEIEENMVKDIDDLFKYTPGVNVQSNSRQGVQSINIRGIEGNRIKVIVDGVAQANQFDSGAEFVNSSRVDVDTDMIKAVEIVKGAASSLQGSDAIGGIVAFETKDPADILKGRDFGGYAKLNYSSSDKTFSESVAIANKVGDLESLVAYTRRDGEELDNFGQPDEQDSSANNLLVKLQYQLNAAHRIEFSGNYIRNKNNLSLDYLTSMVPYENASGSDETEQYQLGIKHIWDVETSFADRITWQLDWMSKEETGVTDRTRVSNGNVQKKDYLYSDEGIQFDAQFDKYFVTGGAEHNLIYGASFSDKDIANTNKEFNSVGSDQVIFYIPDAQETRYGLFAQDEITFGNWIVTPGVRFDSFDTNPGDTSANPSLNAASEYKDYSDSAVTGRLGTVYKLNEENRLFVQISQGFRAPDFQELYYSYGNPMYGYVNKPNPDLEAEESISYEGGWRYNTDLVSNEISLFYSDYDNFIDNQLVSGSFMTGDVVYQSININKAIIKGVELANQLSWNEFMPVEGFSSRIAAAYTEGEDGDGNPLNSVSPWNTVVGLSYDSVNQWGTTVNLSYTAKKSESDIDGDYQPIDAATVVDITAYYKPIKDLTLRAGVFNVTDEEYYNWNDVRGLSAEDKDRTEAKRNFSLTAKYEF
ncbi:TonB-dependent hemoglobin/transferrin/lactoferrin family receptor [Vibrio natriegens]|uniref:TonB-dependent hemoglobin/transferrin/lactoferrin family receptor n=1 Tax=Vibrio natriegens TaxID=691 RepID=UPI002284A352|nr:TonB-dependent hemoglobin/transferrin/lactoferrin family receptor [Vibrio natriegens]MCY9877031.1 TonB-dependent hemoglobin/transferrin/lactoferrin family receptor [Vibrio natriegens]